MSQPVQIKVATPGGEYLVIDNSAAGCVSVNVTPFNVSANGGAGSMTGPGLPNFDTTWPGSMSQGLNAFSNGTIPDSVNLARTVVQSPTVKWRNPA